MRTFFLICAVFLIPIASYAKEKEVYFYVSPKGMDTWSGLKPSPNAQKTDGPFATIQHAIEESRKVDRKKQLPVIVLRGGEYDITDPLELLPEDSRLTIMDYHGERPVISGGKEITGWKVGDDGRWTVELPEVRDGLWDFAELFVNGERRYRPRMPENGYYYVASDLPPTPENVGKGSDRFRYYGSEIKGDWQNLNDIDVLIFQSWTMSRFPIDSVDAATHSVTLDGHTQGADWWGTIPKGNRFILENVKEALKYPGQWYLDRSNGELTYIPMPGETPANTDVVAPICGQFLLVHGHTKDKEWVSDVSIKGIQFEYTNWITPSGGQSFPQSEVNLPGVIQAEGARNLTLQDCTIAHVGLYGVEFGKACKGCILEHCILSDIGAGGVKIGGITIDSDANEMASNNVVRNCLIAHGGRIHPAGCGVWIGQSPGNLISHNEIADFYYTGISSGWTWGYDPNAKATGNIVEYNRIHDIGQGVLSDMGGFYSLGLQTGSVVKNNIFHDISTFSYGGWGIYFDEGTTNILAENNLVYNTKSGGLHQHYGMNNHVTNNIFAFAKEAQLIRTRVEDHLSFTFDHNIVYWKEGALLGSNWPDNHFKLDYNDYWDESGQPVTFAGKSFADWRKMGQDEHSVIADPKFVDPDHYNFHLKADSPALKLGFKPFDYTKSGIPGIRKEEPLAPRAFPEPPPPPPAEPISENFEDLDPGQRPVGGVTLSEENDEAVIRVTDEKAADGKHSLKFTDAPGQKNVFDPHMYYSPGYDEGTLDGSFDFCPEPGAIFFHEWRNQDNPYKTGPSMWVMADGSLFASGQKLMVIPEDRWTHFDIRCGLGDEANGKWSLTVTLPGQPAKTFDNLPCSPDFKSLNWYGFCSMANAKTVFYIDNISLKPMKGA
jgi:hypothetical protein